MRTGTTPRVVAALWALATAAAGTTTDLDAQNQPTRVHQPGPTRVLSPHRPGVRATKLEVKTTVVDGVATTELRQVIRNDRPQIAEATWLLPLPPGAATDHFTMTVGGKEIAGEVLAPDTARRIYEDIVRKRRDPGLLEYVGHGCLRARVFPVPARGELTVHVRYRQVLPETTGLFEYAFPIRAAGIEGASCEAISLDVRIRSRKPIKNVYSPLSMVDFVRHGDHEARASLELAHGQLPDRDLRLYYGTSTAAFGLDLLTHAKDGKPGWFMLMVSPKHDWPKPANTIRIVQFVIDTSGSMQGKKIEQARDALRYFVRSLAPTDRFNVIPFSTEARPFFPEPVAADEESITKAVEQIGGIEARGGTNIEDALHTASRGHGVDLPKLDRDVTVVPITVFLTDGQPTVGTSDIDTLLAQAKKQSATDHARMFVFGVGNDVNTRLLDRLAADSRGDRDYVREDENIEVKTAALFTKLSNPVLTDVELVCDGVRVEQVWPKSLPDLFQGSRLLVLGRYHGDGKQHAVRLRGTVDGTQREYVYEGSFPRVTKPNRHDFVPALWAKKRVAMLLDALRLNGSSKELENEIGQLGREYGIVTPFTSHLIIEEGMHVATARGLPRSDTATSGADSFFLGGGRSPEAQTEFYDRLRRDFARRGLSTPASPLALRRTMERAREEGKKARGRLRQLDADEVGATAVDNSVALRTIEQDTRVGRRLGLATTSVELVRQRVRDRTFCLVGGVWVDASFRAEMRGKERKIKAFSDEYFALLRERPELAPYLALSERVVVVLGGDEAVEIL